MSAQEQERRAAESLAELERRRARYDRDLSESRELAGRLSARAEQLERHLRDVDVKMDEARGTVDRAERDIEALRFGLTSAERALDTAREARADGQVNDEPECLRRQYAQHAFSNQGADEYTNGGDADEHGERSKLVPGAPEIHGRAADIDEYGNRRRCRDEGGGCQFE